MSVRATVQFSVRGRQIGPADFGERVATLDFEAGYSLAPGSGAGQATMIFRDGARELAASATESLDLAGGVTDSFGATVSFARVTTIIVRAAAANTNAVIVGGASSNAFVGPFGASAHTVAVSPGAAIALHNPAGWTVTAGTGDLLRLANGGSGTPVLFDIVVIGS